MAVETCAGTGGNHGRQCLAALDGGHRLCDAPQCLQLVVGVRRRHGPHSVVWAIELWHVHLGAVVAKTAGEPPAVRVAEAFGRLAEAVEDDPTPFVILARAMFDLRYVDPGQRDEEHPGKRMVRLHRRRVARLLADLMAPAVAARVGQRRREEVADEMAWLMMSAGYAGVSDRPQDAITIRDAALLLMADRLGI